MKSEEIKNWEKIKHCYGEDIRINGKDIEEVTSEKLLEFVNEMLIFDTNKDQLLKEVVQLCLEYLQGDLVEDESHLCEQCSDWNSSEKWEIN